MERNNNDNTTHQSTTCPSTTDKSHVRTEKECPGCNYCGYYNHVREECGFKKEDEEEEVIRWHHPDGGRLQDKQYKRTLNQSEEQGGHTVCGYCGIPSHKRENCRFISQDIKQGLIRTDNWKRGHLSRGVLWNKNMEKPTRNDKKVREQEGSQQVPEPSHPKLI